jgi:hypothetical protein
MWLFKSLVAELVSNPRNVEKNCADIERCDPKTLSDGDGILSKPPAPVCDDGPQLKAVKSFRCQLLNFVVPKVFVTWLPVCLAINPTGNQKPERFQIADKFLRHLFAPGVDILPGFLTEDVDKLIVMLCEVGNPPLAPGRGVLLNMHVVRVTEGKMCFSRYGSGFLVELMYVEPEVRVLRWWDVGKKFDNNGRLDQTITSRKAAR